jgi:hypothetical protein
MHGEIIVSSDNKSGAALLVSQHKFQPWPFSPLQVLPDR